jgi:hypothetical protein
MMPNAGKNACIRGKGQAVLKDLTEEEKAALLLEATRHSLVSIRNILLRVVHAQDENPSCPAWALREMLAIADTAHNLPELVAKPSDFSPEMLAYSAKSYRQRYGAGIKESPAFSWSWQFWHSVDNLIGEDLAEWTRLHPDSAQ